jgi:hypothetical protein
MTAKSATNIAFSAKIRKSIILPAGFVISALLEIGLSLRSRGDQIETGAGKQVDFSALKLGLCAIHGMPRFADRRQEVVGVGVGAGGWGVIVNRRACLTLAGIGVASVRPRG